MPGDKATNEKLICSFCGKERVEGECVDLNFKLAECPNKSKDCASRNQDGYQACHGYADGSIGDSKRLGANILAAMPKKTSILTHNAFKRREKTTKDKDGNEITEAINPNGDKTTHDSYNEALKTFQKGVKDDALKDENVAKLMRTFSKRGVEPITKYETEYGAFHPLYMYGNSIQAHHLICVATMKKNYKQWKDVCKIAGYNIDCRWNGVFLPSVMKIACGAKIPLHLGDHGEGYTEKTNYAQRMQDEVDDILKDFQEDPLCGKKNEEEIEKKKEGVIKALNRLSKKAFDNVKDFKWTITWDGFDYMPGNPIGCGGLDSIADKKGTGQVNKKIINEDGELVEKKVDKGYTPEEQAKIDTFKSTNLLHPRCIQDIEEIREAKIKAFHTMLEDCSMYGHIHCPGDCREKPCEKEGCSPDRHLNREHTFVKDILTSRGRYAGNKYTLKYGE